MEGEIEGTLFEARGARQRDGEAWIQAPERSFQTACKGLRAAEYICRSLSRTAEDIETKRV